MLCNTAGQRSCAKQQVKEAVQNSRSKTLCKTAEVKDAVRDSRSKKLCETAGQRRLEKPLTPYNIESWKLEVGSQLYTL